MRIDKFLWCVRICKTRNVAAEYCKKNKVWLNDVLVKSSKEVQNADILQIRKEQINFRFEVLQIPQNRLNAKLVSMYLKNITSLEELERMKAIRDSQEYYRQRGLGRPTKKDRRELDDYLEDFNFEQDEL